MAGITSSTEPENTKGQGGSVRQHELFSYSATETLRNGLRVLIRTLRPADRDDLLAAVRGMSDKSVYRRFFAFRRDFSEKEISKFLDIDFRDHVALVAVIQDGENEIIVAGARYVMIAPGRAELACAVTDKFQGQGLGKIIFRRLCLVAKEAGVRELVAEVLSENVPMIRMLTSSGFPAHEQRNRDVVQVTIELTSAVPSAD